MSNTATKPDESSALPQPPPVPRVAVRRRSRRGRRTIQPIAWNRLILLLSVFAACFLVLTNRRISESVKGVVHGYLPSLANVLRAELVALAICGVILIYLVPGVEDRFLRWVKTQQDARRAARRHSSRRSRRR